METLKKFVLVFFLSIIIISTGNTDKASAQSRFGVSFQTFYDELEPYGRWIHDREYGYVWSPRVSRGFQPYATNGRWIITEYGNTWLSDYPWGWAPFHYGRWTFDDFYGWIWIPDYEWGPAWVSWRHGGGYYGWAPLPPGVNIHISINIPASRWIFVPQRYITSPRIYTYYVPRTRVVNIYRHTTIINNYYDRDDRYYVYGPRRSDIERATRSKVAVHRISDADRPGRPEVRSGSVSIYRPQADKSRPEVSRPSRSTESTYKRDHTSTERNSSEERISSEKNNPSQSRGTSERPSRSESPRYSEPSSRNRGGQDRVSSENRPEPQPQRTSRPQRSQPSEVRREAPRTQSRDSGQGNPSRSSSGESSGRPSRR